MKRLRQRQRLQKNKEKNKPVHIEWAGFSMQQTVADIVEATRFELAASASRILRGIFFLLPLYPKSAYLLHFYLNPYPI